MCTATMHTGQRHAVTLMMVVVSLLILFVLVIDVGGNAGAPSRAAHDQDAAAGHINAAIMTATQASFDTAPERYPSINRKVKSKSSPFVFFSICDEMSCHG